MNQVAREALVSAALRNVRQIRGALYDEHGGRCAMGVLLEAFDGNPSNVRRRDSRDTFKEWSDLSLEEEMEIIDANNELRWDFLTIARKCCLGPEESA